MSNWYLEIPSGEPISQGDIILNCPVFLNKPIIDTKQPDLIGDIETTIGIADVVVLSQACDLEPDRVKVENVVVGYLMDPSTDKISTIIDNDTAEQQKKKRWDFVAEVHAGRRPNYALIGNHNGNPAMNYKIVDFSRIFTLPYQFLMEIRELKGDRLRLNTPHRELLSQQFGNYFTRIGIPNEDFIQKVALKKELGL